jgi:long-chain acyl-CoA synthetase
MLGMDLLDLQKGDRVALFLRNRWEFLAIDSAIMARGLVTVSIDPGWSDQMIVRVMSHAKVRCAFAETSESARRLLGLRSELPRLQSTIVVAGVQENGPELRSFRDLRTAGRSVSNSQQRIDHYLAEIREHDLAMVMYTGGSTGEPKGVARTHRNLLCPAWAQLPWEGDPNEPPARPNELAFDPLSFCHAGGRLFAQMVLSTGRTLALPRFDAKDITLRDLQLLSPTHTMSVPRVLLHIQKLLMPEIHDLWKKIEVSSVKASDHTKLRSEFASRVRELLGGRLRFIFWSAAPLTASLFSFFEENAGIPMLGFYGSTEVGVVTMQDEDKRLGTVGKSLAGGIRIENGEILCRGPFVTPGYLDNPDATALVLAPNGWWCTGDLGTFDDGGNLIVKGRARAMFNCNDGTNIDPAQIEQLLESDPYIRQAILFGHRRPFLAAFIAVDRERIAGESGEGGSDVRKFIATRIDQINDRLEEFERVRRFHIIDGDFAEPLRRISIANKINVDREAVEIAYREQIADFYKD